MNFKTAVRRTIKGIADYRGVASPAEFWLGAAVLTAVAGLVMWPWPIAIAWGNANITSELFYAMYAVQTLAFLYLGATFVALTARRLRDAGRSRFWASPLASIIVLGALMNVEPATNWLFGNSADGSQPVPGLLEAIMIWQNAATIFTLIMVLGKSKNANPIEAKYCSNCGASVTVAAAAYCASCGSQVG
ncbi:MAG: hypothetical protein RL196_454 [Actinomycetota bacterium]|jgi:uncharacterized membrane protein YhaH (DUF805 family)